MLLSSHLKIFVPLFPKIGSCSLVPFDICQCSLIPQTPERSLATFKFRCVVCVTFKIGLHQARFKTKMANQWTARMVSTDVCSKLNREGRIANNLNYDLRQVEKFQEAKGYLFSPLRRENSFRKVVEYFTSKLVSILLHGLALIQMEWFSPRLLLLVCMLQLPQVYDMQLHCKTRCLNHIFSNLGYCFGYLRYNTEYITNVSFGYCALASFSFFVCVSFPFRF